jgi:GT2 family glycosyltransferase/glycosyltransferase involved in cell wall biosynthesis
VTARLGRLYRRYAQRHLAVSRQGPALRDAEGRVLGRVECVALRDGRLVVEGRAEADLVVLELAGRRAAAHPRPQGGGRPSFRLELPFLPGVPVLDLTHGDETHRFDLAAPGALRLAAARGMLLPGFAWRSLRAAPAALRWLQVRDRGARERVKRVLGLGPPERELRIEPARLPGDGPAAGMASSAAPVMIVMPVHDAFDLLVEALERIERHSDLPWHLVLVEDASPDARIRPFLRHRVAAWGPSRATLVENAENLGFIGAVNRGLAIARERDAQAPVVLLNTDALVPEGWLSRLVAPLADPTVATVTPMANDAELMSVPAICVPTALRPGEADAVDALARRLPALADLPEAPTGVGFCMAIAPRFLARAGGFDPAFGRGYGEEVDWCQRVAAMGGRHLCQPRLFVEHRGGASFGSEEKARLLRINGALVSARHPAFDTEVQGFIGEDPLVTERLALGLGWAAARVGEAPVAIFLAHALGGGAGHDLRRRVAADVRALGAAVVLRVGGAARWRIELHVRGGRTAAGTDDAETALRLLSLLPRRRVVYACGVGDPDPIGIPALLLALAEGPGHRLEVLFHDYFPVSPAYTLLGADGVWRGLPVPGQEGPGHATMRPDGSLVSLAAWQAEWGRLVAAADELVVFSGSSRDLVAAAWPEAAGRIALRPHAPLVDLPRLPPPPPGARPVLGVLGNIGEHKGAGVLAALSRRLARAEGRGIGLVVLGDVDPAFRLRRPARVHGGYAQAEIPDLVRRYGITHWLIPSIWPETFSFATHEALATGLPVLAFDLGAQGEAVRVAQARGAAGLVLPLPATAEEAAAAILAAVLRAGPAAS